MNSPASPDQPIVRIRDRAELFDEGDPAVLDAIEGEEFIFKLRSPDASGLLHDAAQASGKFVVMPMRL